MSDLLDTLHYLFEEDQAPVEEEISKARERMRSRIYTELYGYKDYSWMSSNAGAASASGSVKIDMPMDSDTMTTGLPKYEHKPFIPATPIDVDSPLPIAGLKEAPLG